MIDTLCRLPRQRADGAGARLPPAAQALARQRLPLRAHLLGLCAQALQRHGALAGSCLSGWRLLRCHPWCDGGCDPVPEQPPARGLFTRLGRRHRPPILPSTTEPPMTDMRRTLLWVVFSMSLVLLWDAWNKHTGQPSMFGGAPRPAAAPAPRPAPAPAGVPAAACRAGGGAAPAGAAAAAACRAAPARRRAPASRSPSPPTSSRPPSTARAARWCGWNCWATATTSTAAATWCCSTRAPSALYLAQTGLITAQAGAGAAQPPDADDACVPGERTLAAGAQRAEVRFESPDVGGVKLVKTYTFKRGDYTIGVKHEFINDGGRAGHAAAVPATGARRQPAAKASRASTSPSPARRSTPTPASSRRSTSRTSTRATAEPRQDRPTTAGWRWCSTTSPRPGWCPTTGAARVPHRQGRRQPSTSVAHGAAAGRGGAGRHARPRRARCSPARRRRRSSPRWRPGLELVKDYGWFTILAKPLFWLLTSCTAARQLGLGHRRRWWCC